MINKQFRRIKNIGYTYLKQICVLNFKDCFLEHRPKSPHHSHSPPIEKPRNKEHKSEMPQKLFESPAPEHNAHRNMIAELKAKFQTLSSDEEPEGNALKTLL
jgi:hypothetical protein